MEPVDWDAIKRNKDELYRKSHPQNEEYIPQIPQEPQSWHYTAKGNTNEPYDPATYTAPKPLAGGINNPFK